MKNLDKTMKDKPNVFLDSGAFSAWSKSVEIEIQEYIAFIKKYKKYIDNYAVLDVIGNAEATLTNQKTMESAGLNPIPCYHYGEDKKYLEYYLKNYDYIALGGMVPISSKDLIPWLDELFSNYICDKDGMPTVKIHGFGLTALKLMLRYPWYSVDSTSWVMTGRLGAVLIPRKKNDKYIYNIDPFKVNISLNSPTTKEAGKHLNTFSTIERDEIKKYLQLKGYKIGKAKIKKVKDDYKLQENEKWFDKKRDKNTVLIILEDGLSTNYKLRDEINIIYYVDLEKSMNEYPRRFKITVMKGFI